MNNNLEFRVYYLLSSVLLIMEAKKKKIWGVKIWAIVYNVT